MPSPRRSATRVSIVGVRPLDLDAFMPVTVGGEITSPRSSTGLRYYGQDKVLFRFVRTP